MFGHGAESHLLSLQAIVDEELTHLDLVEASLEQLGSCKHLLLHVHLGS